MSVENVGRIKYSVVGTHDTHKKRQMSRGKSTTKREKCSSFVKQHTSRKVIHQKGKEKHHPSISCLPKHIRRSRMSSGEWKEEHRLCV